MTSKEAALTIRQLKAIADNLDERAKAFGAALAAKLHAIAGDLRREAAVIASEQSGEPAS
ncbi:hypothetical protein C8N35_102117 [Breoghania corrubedonensis]|uniref:Uncharacterized protein n=1 Tax=Breoghania corrubedonensis TaxID=665038 RepID=A0A2T5VCD5_9HYPH|nr:hypothetical protein [Breoghania corrubedonensis]PTW61408.1 hypothetical protein C8N35_102117 [Breoghania corrubedonensis]